MKLIVLIAFTLLLSANAFIDIDSMAKSTSKTVLNHLQSHIAKRDLQASCTWEQVTALESALGNSIDALGGADTHTEFSLSIAAIFTNYFDYFNCLGSDEQLLSVLTFEDKEITKYATQDCPDEYLETPESNDDPCCHERLLNEQCCAHRDITFTKTGMVSGTNATNRREHCAHPVRSAFLGEATAASMVWAESGLCEAVGSVYGFGNFFELFAPVSICYVEVLGGVECNMTAEDPDAECIGDSICLGGRCQTNPAAADISLLACLSQTLPDDIEFFIRRIWGIPMGNEELYVQRFIQTFVQPACSDPSFEDESACLEDYICSTYEGQNETECTGYQCTACLSDLFELDLESRDICFPQGYITDNETCAPGVCTNWGKTVENCNTDGCSKGCPGDVLCSTEEECRAVGECNDWIFGSGVCTHERTDESCESRGFEDFQHESSICLPCKGSEANSSVCEAAGGNWTERATDKASCLARTCCEGRLDSASIFEFEEQGVWGPGLIFPTRWQPAQWQTVNTWGPDINGELIGEIFERAFMRRFSYTARSVFQCSFLPIVRFSLGLACDCGSMTGTPDNCFERRAIRDGVDPLFEGIVAEQERRFYKWVKGAESVIGTIDVTWKIIEHRAERSRLAEESMKRQADVVLYAENEAGEQVGVIVSNYVEMSITEFGDDSQLQTLELCLTRAVSSEEITEWSEDYPVWGFAYTADLDSGEPVIIDVEVRLDTDENDIPMYCADVSEEGWYVAVLKQMDEETTSSTAPEIGDDDDNSADDDDDVSSSPADDDDDDSHSPVLVTAIFFYVLTLLF